MCPGPLGVYEKFFTLFKNKEINNINLSKFIIHNLHPFYKTFLNKDINSRVEILEDKQKTYQIYKCLDLHPSIISFSIQNLKITNTFDEDVLVNDHVSLSDIGYLNNPNEGIIITLESFDTERAVISQNINFKDLKTISSNIYDLIKYCDIKNSYLNINNSLRGNFFLSTKNIKKKLPFLGISSEKIKMLKNIMKNNNFKINNKENVIDQFLNFKKNNFNIKNIYLKKYENRLNSVLKYDVIINEKLNKENLKELMKLEKKEEKLIKTKKEQETLIKFEKNLQSLIKSKKEPETLIKLEKNLQSLIKSIKEQVTFQRVQKNRVTFQRVQKNRVIFRSVQKNIEKLNLIIPSIEKAKKLQVEKIKNLQEEKHYTNLVIDENIIKLSILSLSILFFKSMPDFIQKPFIMIKQKNRSIQFINKNINLIRFLLIVPSKTMFKILIKRII